MAPMSTALATGIGSSFFFVVLNVAMNIYTKWLFADIGGNFPLPWTMLFLQQVQTFLVLHPGLILMRKRGWDRPTGIARSTSHAAAQEEATRISSVHVFQVCLVTLLFCVNVGLNSMSLVVISISLNQTVRAFLPVGVLLLGCCIEQQAYPCHSYISTSVLVLGIIMTCWGSPDFQWYGFLLCFVSTVTAAVSTSLNGLLLNNGPFGKSGPFGVAQLIYIQSIPAIFIFAAIAYFSEGPRAREKFSLDSGHQLQTALTFLIVSFSSVLALLSNLGRCFLVAATNPLTETLAGNAKVAALCIIDHQLFGTSFPLKNYLGIGLVFSAFSAHLLLQYASKDDEPKGTGWPGPTAGPSNTPGGNSSKRQVKRPRLISAADTGLAAEHLAVELGREPAPPKRSGGLGTNGSLAAIPELPRPRSVTWPQPASTESRGMLAGVDFSLVLELPPWLSSSGQTGSPEDYSPLSVASLSPMARRSLASPTLPSGGGSPTSSAARSRFYSDPTDTLNNNRRSLMEDVRLGNHMGFIEEEAPLETSAADGDGEPNNLEIGYL